jgi:hypothetical protein
MDDNLKIAWKTKCSVHTIEEDVISLAKISEGKEITIKATDTGSWAVNLLMD